MQKRKEKVGIAIASFLRLDKSREILNELEKKCKELMPISSVVMGN